MSINVTTPIKLLDLLFYLLSAVITILAVIVSLFEKAIFIESTSKMQFLASPFGKAPLLITIIF